MKTKIVTKPAPLGRMIKQVKPLAKIGLASLMLLFATESSVKAQNFSQNPVWTFGGKKISFTNGNFAAPTVTSVSNSPTSGANNSFSDPEGNVLFYVEKDVAVLNIYKADGTQLNPSSITFGSRSNEIALVAKPGSCDEVYVIFSSDYPSGSQLLQYYIVNTSNWGVSLGGSHSYGGAGIAVGKIRPDGQQFLYVLSGTTTVYKYSITNQGIVPANTGNMWGGPSNQVIPFHTSFDSNPYYVGSTSSTSSEINEYFASELELSHDGTRLAWGTGYRYPGNTAQVAYVKLNADGNLFRNQPDPYRSTNYAKVIEVPASEGRINGVEFHPDNGIRTLYVTAGLDVSAYNNGINKIDFYDWDQNPSTSPSPQPVNLGGSYPYAQSMIELAYNKQLVVAGTNVLRQINYNSNGDISFGLFIPGVTAPAHTVSYGSNPPLRVLSDQIDSYGYNFTKLITGPATATANNQVSFHVPWVSGAWYDWYLNGQLISPAPFLDWYHTFTHTYESTDSIRVVAHHPCGYTTTYTKVIIVNPGSSDPIPPGGGTGSRLALENNPSGVTVYADNLQNILTVHMPATEKNYDLYITDMKGSIVKTVNTTGGKHQIGFNNLSSGLYLIKIVGQNILHTQKFTVSH